MVGSVLNWQVERKTDIRAIAGRGLRQVRYDLAPGIMKCPAPSIDAVKQAVCGTLDPLLAIPVDARETDDVRSYGGFRIEAAIVLLREYSGQIEAYGALCTICRDLPAEIDEMAVRCVRVLDDRGINLQNVCESPDL
nr:hypothetical protein [Paraburkholderia bannensis]